jgi:predicted nuclease of predicted toxin-antitoxin system
VIAFLVDQNFNEHIVDGLTRRDPTLEFTHVRDVGLVATTDPVMLEWAAAKGLILLTHDRKTIPAFAHARVAAGLPMPGVFLVSDDLPIGQAIDELLLAAECLSADECRNIVRYFPL